MRKLFIASLLIGFVSVGACARVSDIDRMQPGTQVTVTMKDGSVVSGRLVQAKPDTLVVDPAEGGDWKTLVRGQIASVDTTQTASSQAQAPAAPPETGPSAAPEEPTARAPRARSGSATGHRTTVRPSHAGPAPVAGREVTIPAGTLLHARLETQVASDTSHVEDRVTASLTEPVVVDDTEVVPTGSTLRGIVTDAKPSGRVKGRAEVAFRFDVLEMPDGAEQRVQTHTVAVQAPATKKKDALKIGAPAAGGAILGGILGGGKGAAIGAAVGGGAGTAVVLSTPGKEVHLPPGSSVTVKVVEPVTFRVATSQ